MLKSVAFGKDGYETQQLSKKQLTQSTEIRVLAVT